MADKIWLVWGSYDDSVNDYVIAAFRTQELAEERRQRCEDRYAELRRKHHTYAEYQQIIHKNVGYWAELDPYLPYTRDIIKYTLQDVELF